MEKLCRHCNAMKPATEFHKDKSKPDGLTAYCKTCHKAKQSHYSANTPSKNDAKDGFKVCQTCQTRQPVANFSKNRARFDGYTPRCRICNAEKHRAWLAKNPGIRAAYAADWRQKNPRLAKDFGLRAKYGIPLGTYDRLLAEQGGRCAICQSTDSGGRGDFHVDHSHLKTGVESVRGLLCNACNALLGYSKDRVETLQAAIQYLTERC